METVLARRCETCCHHAPGASPVLGTCRHPRRQPPTGTVIPFVRNRELGCYGGWGVDSWLDCTRDDDRAALFHALDPLSASHRGSPTELTRGRGPRPNAADTAIDPGDPDDEMN